MYNSYMFNDKLHIFTYKNTIYQSKLKFDGDLGIYLNMHENVTFPQTTKFGTHESE